MFSGDFPSAAVFDFTLDVLDYSLFEKVSVFGLAPSSTSDKGRTRKGHISSPDGATVSGARHFFREPRDGVAVHLGSERARTSHGRDVTKDRSAVRLGAGERK